MSEKKTEKEKKLHIELVSRMLTLATAGFGLVAALAWNSLIQELVDKYIKVWFPDSGLLTLFIYAIVITIVAVVVTYQLSKLLQRLESK